MREHHCYAERHTADVGAGAVVHVDIKVVAGATGVLAEEALGVRLLDGTLQCQALVDVLTPAQPTSLRYRPSSQRLVCDNVLKGPSTREQSCLRLDDPCCNCRLRKKGRYSCTCGWYESTMLSSFAPDVDVCGAGAHGHTRDQAALDQLVGVVAHDFAVLARPRLTLISVHHQVGWAAIRYLHSQFALIKGCTGDHQQT